MIQKFIQSYQFAESFQDDRFWKSNAPMGWLSQTAWYIFNYLSITKKLITYQFSESMLESTQGLPKFDGIMKSCLVSE